MIALVVTLHYLLSHYPHYFVASISSWENHTLKVSYWSCRTQVFIRLLFQSDLPNVGFVTLPPTSKAGIPITTLHNTSLDHGQSLHMLPSPVGRLSIKTPFVMSISLWKNHTLKINYWSWRAQVLIKSPFQGDFLDMGLVIYLYYLLGPV